MGTLISHQLKAEIIQRFKVIEPQLCSSVIKNMDYLMEVYCQGHGATIWSLFRFTHILKDMTIIS